MHTGIIIVIIISPTDHVTEVEHVDIVDPMVRLSPSKEDRPVPVHLGEREVGTGRRSLSFEFRGRPDTWKWVWIKQLSMAHKGTSFIKK